MKYSIGDKVRILSNDDGSGDYIGKIGTIIDTDRIKQGYSSEWDYECKFDNGGTYIFGPHELEKAHKKGEQLLLFEM